MTTPSRSNRRIASFGTNWREDDDLPKIRGILLVVRSPQDLRILTHPPWWTPGRLKLAIGSLLLALVGAQLKESPAEDLIQTIRTVMSGKTAISPDVQRILADEPVPPHLTDKQSDILHAIVDGLTNKSIASKFNLSEGGVKKHLSLIFSKLGATTRSEAVAIALRKHLLKI